MPEEPVRTTTEVEVRYAETDQMGVVHHASFLVWFELARTRLCLASGVHYAEIERGGHLLVVIGTEMRLRGAARYGDTVSVDCWIDRLASRALRFAYEVRRGDEALVTGSTEHLWVRADDRRPCRIPQELAAPFARLAGRSG